MLNETIYLFVDAHHTALAAVLAQGPSIEDCLPVIIASRATSKIEQRYPQLDLEGIAVGFGLRRFNQYLIGGPQVNMITDHKPLVSIFQIKRLGSLCLDHIKLCHLDINSKLIWKKGATNPADYASRHATPLSHLPKHIQQELEEYSKLCWLLHKSPYMEYLSIAALQEHTSKDEILQDLSAHILHNRKPEASSNCAAYSKVFDELTISDGGLIMQGEWVVLPTSLIDSAVERAHQGVHPGESNFKCQTEHIFGFRVLTKQ